MMTQQIEETMNSEITDLEKYSDILLNNYNNKEESVVWPSMAVVANIPLEKEDDSYLEDTAKHLKIALIYEGYKPVKVYPLWSCLGDSGFAVVDFGKDLDGYKNAMEFVKVSEVEKHGRKEWYDGTSPKDMRFYAWIANEEDYNCNGVVGDFLRKKGVLKTLSEIKKENEPKSPQLLMGLETLVEEISKKSKEVQSQVSIANCHMDLVMKQKDFVMKQKDTLIQNFNEDLKTMQEKANKMIEDIQVKLQHEDHEKKMNEAALLEQKKAYDRLLKLAYDDKRDKEVLHYQITELQKKMDDNEVLMKILTEENIEAKKKVELIQEDVKEKEKEIEDLKENVKEIEELKELNQALIVKEKLLNDELEDARKELISGLREMYDPASSSAINIGVKRKINEDDLEEVNNDYSLVTELWNRKDNRRATLKQGFQFIFKQLKQTIR